MWGTNLIRHHSLWKWTILLALGDKDQKTSLKWTGRLHLDPCVPFFAAPQSPDLNFACWTIASAAEWSTTFSSAAKVCNAIHADLSWSKGLKMILKGISVRAVWFSEKHSWWSAHSYIHNISYCIYEVWEYSDIKFYLQYLLEALYRKRRLGIRHHAFKAWSSGPKPKGNDGNDIWQKQCWRKAQRVKWGHGHPHHQSLPRSFSGKSPNDTDPLCDTQQGALMSSSLSLCRSYQPCLHKRSLVADVWTRTNPFIIFFEGLTTNNSANKWTYIVTYITLHITI